MTVSIQVLFCQCIFIVLHPFPVVWRRYKVQMETFGLLPTSTSCLSVFFCGLYLEVSWSTLGPGVFLYPSRVARPR